MSTRCQMGFYWDTDQALSEPDALIYRHSDGYPDTKHGVPQTVTPVVRAFIKERGFWDAEYCAAWVVKTLKTEVTNYGVSMRLHGDIEYYYAFYPDRLAVYTVHNPSWDEAITFAHLTPLKTLKYRFKVPQPF